MSYLLQPLVLLRWQACTSVLTMAHKCLPIQSRFLATILHIIMTDDTPARALPPAVVMHAKWRRVQVAHKQAM